MWLESVPRPRAYSSIFHTGNEVSTCICIDEAPARSIHSAVTECSVRLQVQALSFYTYSSCTSTRDTSTRSSVTVIKHKNKE
jgi:hypothetical protein